MWTPFETTPPHRMHMALQVATLSVSQLKFALFFASLDGPKLFVVLTDPVNACSIADGETLALCMISSLRHAALRILKHGAFFPRRLHAVICIATQCTCRPW